MELLLVVMIMELVFGGYDNIRGAHGELMMYKRLLTKHLIQV